MRKLMVSGTASEISACRPLVGSANSWTTPQTGPGLFERGGTDTFTKRFVKTDAGAWRLVR